MFTVYILHSITLDRYYVGFTNDFERRLTALLNSKLEYICPAKCVNYVNFSKNCVTTTFIVCHIFMRSVFNTKI